MVSTSPSSATIRQVFKQSRVGMVIPLLGQAISSAPEHMPQIALPRTPGSPTTLPSNTDCIPDRFQTPLTAPDSADGTRKLKAGIPGKLIIATSCCSGVTSTESLRPRVVWFLAQSGCNAATHSRLGMCLALPHCSIALAASWSPVLTYLST
jgi:hypothetical protein